MVERRLWFVKRNGAIKGPFFSAQITRNILLGRLRPDDELSPDENNWKPVANYRELYPDVMRADPVHQGKLEAARIQADERLLDQRQHKQQMANERRRAKERRTNESDAMLLHRQHRKHIDEVCKNDLKRPRIPVFSILFITTVIIGFGYVLNPDSNKLESDCSLPPDKGVNWSNCDFVRLNAENQNLESAILTDASLNESKLMGVNLIGSNMAYAEIKQSDLSYANLEGVRLIGANLKYTDLSYANLKDADLSYADLSHSIIAGADFSNTRLDNAIWTDGKICSKGSIGKCLKN